MVLFSLFLFVACGEKQNNTIIVYTNSGTNGRQEYLEAEAKKAGFDIKVVSAGGTDIANRLLAEKNKPIADVVFGLNAVEYEKLKKVDLLEKYEPSWGKDVPAGLSDKEGFYNAVTMTPLLAVYNEEAVGENIPHDWVELSTNPVFEGRYSIFPLTGGTSKAILSSILVRYKDENGDLGVSDEGWDVIRQYLQHAHIQMGKEDYWGDLMSGKYPILMMWASGAIERGNKFNYKYGVMKPEIGVPVVVEQLSLIKGSKNKETAQKFIDWCGSAEFQGEWAKQFGTIPVLPAALAMAPEQNKVLRNEIKIQDMDWKYVASHIDSWIEKVQLQYIK